MKLDSTVTLPHNPHAQFTNSQGEYCLGIDIGYGYVKHIDMTSSASSLTDDALIYSVSSFPSHCVPYRAGRLDAVGYFGSTDDQCEIIRLNETAFAVGATAANHDDGIASRPLHQGYTSTTEYRILLASTFKKLRAPDVIDRLVLGVPVGLGSEKIDSLKSAYTGKFLFDNRSIEIRKVMVLHQPIGGIVWEFHKRRLRMQQSQRVVLGIDVGYRTVDWVVIRSLALQPARSGSVPGGVSRIVDCVARGIAIDHGIETGSETIRARIETSINSGFSPLRLDGRCIDISGYAQMITHQINSVLNPLLSKTSPLEDIDSVLIFGGGAKLYAEEIKNKFGSNRCAVLVDPGHSNVKGFQVAALGVPL
jgi:plasmid segregation protein ParM